MAAVFLYAPHQLLWKASWFFSVSLEQHLTLLMSLVEHSPRHSLINATGYMSAYICTDIVHCTLSLIMSYYGVYRRRLWGIRQHSHVQNTITGGVTRQEFNYIFFFSFIYTHCSLCPHVCLALRDAGFWQCPSSLLAVEHLRDEMHPDTQGWFSPPLTPAGGRHDLITGGNE